LFKYNPNNQKNIRNTGAIQNTAYDNTGAPGARPQVTRTGCRGAVPLSTAHITPSIKYYPGASIFKTSKNIKMPAVGGGKRNRITSFSRQSRRRLMMTLGAIKRSAKLPYFVTLTYPGQFPTLEIAKRDLQVFLKRLERENPDCGYIWKLEPQERGAPHYHLLVWGKMKENILSWVVDNWYDIAGQGDENHWKFHIGALKGSKPCVTKVESWRGVWAYASKYLGKTFDVAGWDGKWTGRFWGIGNRQNIPFSTPLEIMITYQQVVSIMRYQRRFSHIKTRQYNSMSIFCDADQWIKKIQNNEGIPNTT